MTVATERSVSQIWWLFLLQGIAALLLGIMLLTAPGATLATIVMFVGAYWLVSGIFAIVSIFVRDKEGVPWGWSLAYGILGVIAGIAVLNHPLLSTVLLPTMLIYFIAIDGLIMGVIGLVHAFQGDGLAGGLLGALSIIFGIVLLAHPLLAASTLPLVGGVFGVVGGVALIIKSFQIKS